MERRNAENFWCKFRTLNSWYFVCTVESSGSCVENSEANKWYGKCWDAARIWGELMCFIRPANLLKPSGYHSMKKLWKGKKYAKDAAFSIPEPSVFLTATEHRSLYLTTPLHYITTVLKNDSRNSSKTATGASHKRKKVFKHLNLGRTRKLIPPSWYMSSCCNPSFGFLRCYNISEIFYI